jgi:hypothetical protein
MPIDSQQGRAIENSHGLARDGTSVPQHKRTSSLWAACLPTMAAAAAVAPCATRGIVSIPLAWGTMWSSVGRFHKHRTMIDSLICAEVHAGAARCAHRRHLLATDPARAARELASHDAMRHAWQRDLTRFRVWADFQILR